MIQFSAPPSTFTHQKYFLCDSVGFSIVSCFIFYDFVNSTKSNVQYIYELVNWILFFFVDLLRVPLHKWLLRSCPLFPSSFHYFWRDFLMLRFFYISLIIVNHFGWNLGEGGSFQYLNFSIYVNTALWYHTAISMITNFNTWPV